MSIEKAIQENTAALVAMTEQLSLFNTTQAPANAAPEVEEKPKAKAKAKPKAKAKTNPKVEETKNKLEQLANEPSLFEEKETTIDDVREALSKVAENDPAATRAILKSLNAAKLSDLKPEDYQKAVDLTEAVLTEAA